MFFTCYILNKTKYPSQRWRIIAGGLGFYKEPEDSPLRHLRIAKGMKRKSIIEGYAYHHEFSILSFFHEPEVPLEVRKNAKEWLVANGYADWLKRNNL